MGKKIDHGIINHGFTKVSELSLGSEFSVGISLGSNMEPEKEEETEDPNDISSERTSGSSNSDLYERSKEELVAGIQERHKVLKEALDAGVSISDFVESQQKEGRSLK